MENEKSCSESLAPKIASLKECVIICTVLIIIAQAVGNFLVFYNIKRVTGSKHYKIIEALEQIHDVQIIDGKVYPRVKKSDGLNLR